MKIVFIGGRDVRILGGIENYMFNLATQLVRLGHEPIVFCESDHSGEEMLNGFRVISVKGPSSRFLCKPVAGLKATLRVIFKEKGVDFIHYNAWPPSLWSPLARLAGIPSLMEGHGLEWKRSKYTPRQQKIMKAMEKFSARINRNLAMCSEDQVRYFREEYGKEAICIPGGINLPDKKPVPDTFGIGRPYFLFMGRLVQEKNADVLIRAFLKEKPEGYRLVIAGGNDADPGYVEYLKGCAGQSPDINFTGPVYGEKKEWLLSNASAFFLPSTIEGLSIVLMEAMAHHLPIVASSIEANRELLSDNAIFVEPEDEESLCEAIRQTPSFDFSTFVERNYDNISNNYTWPGIARKYIEVVTQFSNPCR